MEYSVKFIENLVVSKMESTGKDNYRGSGPALKIQIQVTNEVKTCEHDLGFNKTEKRDRKFNILCCGVLPRILC